MTENRGQIAENRSLVSGVGLQASAQRWLKKTASLIEKETDEVSYEQLKKFQITKHKYQMVRQARHHPEPGRRANHNDLNSKFETVGG